MANPETTDLPSVQARFQCASHDGTTLLVDIDVNDPSGIVISCSGKKDQHAHWVCLDAYTARQVAEAIKRCVDRMEAMNV